MKKISNTKTSWLLTTLLVAVLVGITGCADGEVFGPEDGMTPDGGGPTPDGDVVTPDGDMVPDGDIIDVDSGLPANVAFFGAPPAMPHKAYSCNVDCLNCHKTGGGTIPVTTHPERMICVQCHIPQQDVANFVDTNFKP